MKRIILSIMMIAALSACGNGKKTDNKVTEPAGKTETADMHTAENSLDYWGVYKGTLPAADCPGIETTLTINKDSTFTLHSVYIDRKDATFDNKGTYTIDGSILTTKEKDGSAITYYKVEEGQLRMLNADKQPVTGPLAENYILKKE